ncbi:MAG: Gfo/Idh/MocA family oxidoreductase [Candidatus Poribacteria bacterium]|nr:Gfo/Idh/MocA family oxidoreductase [Candidatus Poribacteria bacterium]
MKVRVGVVGVGHRGMSFVHALAKMEDVTLVALADLHPQRLQLAAQEFDVDRQFTHLSEMLDSVKLDAVLILTPDLAHHPQTLKSLAAGVHVLVEKPPAYTVAETQEMAAAAEKAGKHLMVAWNRIFALRRVKELFAQEPPKLVLVNFVRPNPAYLALIRNHAVDVLHFICGEPADIVAQGEMFNEQQEGHVLASIRFRNGILGQLTSSFGTGGHSEQFTAYGNGYTVFIESTSRGQGRIMRGGQEMEVLGPVDSTALQIRHFIDCIKDDKAPLTSGREAVRIMRLMWSIMDAAGIGMPPLPDDGRGWLLWCTCGARVIPNLEMCPQCGQEWAGWSIPIESVRKI